HLRPHVGHPLAVWREGDTAVGADAQRGFNSAEYRHLMKLATWLALGIIERLAVARERGKFVVGFRRREELEGVVRPGSLKPEARHLALVLRICDVLPVWRKSRRVDTTTLRDPAYLHRLSRGTRLLRSQQYVEQQQSQ